ncbi:MAG: hypothetical protein LUO93_02920 [Methanomicrobiales archaeon]|nr:hypothetical protein [Methanomicrobiales archaeon]
MKERYVIVGAVIVAVFLAGCTGGPGPGMPTPPPPSLTPIVPVTTFPTLPVTPPENISVNWAGYVVETTFEYPDKNAIEAVEAVWNVPAVNCSSAERKEYSSAFWVGIDGFSSGSVEQIGTDSDCIRGSAVYYAWYELYPRDSVTLDLVITSGDEIHAKVMYLGDRQFMFSLTDITSNQSVYLNETTTTTVERNSAEWIAEAPVYRHQILPLSEFGPVEFMNVSVTVNGTTGPIISDQWEYRSIVMEAPDGTLKAFPTGVVNENRFTIIWEHR